MASKGAFSITVLTFPPLGTTSMKLASAIPSAMSSIASLDFVFSKGEGSISFLASAATLWEWATQFRHASTFASAIPNMGSGRGVPTKSLVPLSVSTCAWAVPPSSGEMGGGRVVILPLSSGTAYSILLGAAENIFSGAAEASPGASSRRSSAVVGEASQMKSA